MTWSEEPTLHRGLQFEVLHVFCGKNLLTLVPSEWSSEHNEASTPVDGSLTRSALNSIFFDPPQRLSRASHLVLLATVLTDS